MFFSKENIDDCAKLEDKFLDVLNKHVPLKRHERLSKCNAICSGFVFKLTRNQGMFDRGFKLCENRVKLVVKRNRLRIDGNLTD